MKKVAVMSSAGKALASAKDEFDLAFDKIKDLIFVATGIKMFSKDTGLLLYQKLVLGTRRVKDDGSKKSQIAAHVRPYRKMFEAYRERITQEDLTWIMEVDIDIVTGNSKSAKLPLSKVYDWCLKNDDTKLGTLEANLYYIFMHLVDEAKEADDYKKLVEICGQYEMEEDTSTKQAVASVVNKVKATVAKGGVGEDTSPEQLTAMVKSLIGDGTMEGSMGGLATDLLSGKLTIQGLIENVKSAVEGAEDTTPAIEAGVEA